MNNETKYYKNRIERANQRYEREEHTKKLTAIALGFVALTGATAYSMHKTNEIEKPQLPSTSETSTTMRLESSYTDEEYPLHEEISVPVPIISEISPPYEINVTTSVRPPTHEDFHQPPHQSNER